MVTKPFFWIIGQNGMLSRAFQSLCIDQQIPFIATNRTEVDVTSWESVSQWGNQGFSHIINCSGYTYVDEAERKSHDAYLLNVIGVEHLCRWALQNQLPLIHFSSDYVFDGTKTTPYEESDGASPISVYGMTKYHSEKIVKQYMTDYLILRISWLYGPGKNFVATMLKLFQEKKEVKVVSDQIGGPTYAGDVVEFILNHLDLRGLYHFSCKEYTSWYLFAEAIASELKQRNWQLAIEKIIPIDTSQYPTLASRPKFSMLGMNTLKSLGILEPNWKESLSRYMNTLEGIEHGNPT